MQGNTTKTKLDLTKLFYIEFSQLLNCYGKIFFLLHPLFNYVAHRESLILCSKRFFLLNSRDNRLADNHLTFLLYLISVSSCHRECFYLIPGRSCTNPPSQANTDEKKNTNNQQAIFLINFLHFHKVKVPTYHQNGNCCYDR